MMKALSGSLAGVVRSASDAGALGERHPRAAKGVASAPVRALCAVLFAILLGYVVSLFARPVADSQLWLDGWGVAGFELLASFLIFARGIFDRDARGYASLLGLGGTAWALGDLVNAYMAAHGQNPPSPALFNYFWAGFFVFAFAGLMVLMNRDVIKITAANYLDGLLVLVSAAALIITLFGPIHRAAGGDSATVATNLVYPALDVPVLGLVLTGFALL